jgi:hypothetical protein
MGRKHGCSGKEAAANNPKNANIIYGIILFNKLVAKIKMYYRKTMARKFFCRRNLFIRNPF